MTPEEREAVKDLVTAVIAVEGRLQEPYPDRPEWTPWTRFIERPLKRLYALAYPPPYGDEDGQR